MCVCSMASGYEFARPVIIIMQCAGTGKTLLARATAAECGASFLVVGPSTVMSKWVGESVRIIRACFSLAAKLAPCVLFLDEVLPPHWPLHPSCRA